MASVQFFDLPTGSPDQFLTLWAGIAGYTPGSTLTVNFGTLSDPSVLPLLDAVYAQFPELDYQFAGTQAAFPWEGEMMAALNSASGVIPIAFDITTDPALADLQIQGFDGLTANGSGILEFGSSPALAQSGSEYVGYGAVNVTDARMQVAAETGGGSFQDWQLLKHAGHLLGLGGPQDMLAFSDGLPGPNPWNNARFTVMANTEDAASLADDHGHAVSFSAIDIAALHLLYGANWATHATDTVYSLSDAGAAALDLDGEDGNVSIGRAWYTIWDGAGTDEVRYNGAQDALINLNAAAVTYDLQSQQSDPDVAGLTFLLDHMMQSGDVRQEFWLELFDPDTNGLAQFSRLFDPITETFQAGGISIARDAVIENARGGSGNDLLIGNDADNRLLGNDGDDVIFAGVEGNNYLSGGNGNDILHSIAGENELIGGNGDDTLWGGYFNDILNGGKGNDWLAGGEGDDNLKGGSGDDILAGEDGADTLLGGSGHDELYGMAGNDILKGGSGFDILHGDDFGTVSDDKLYGNAGNDVLNGGGGVDELYGGSDDDELNGGAGNDKLRGGSGVDVLNGDDGDDNLRGGADNDIVLGGDGNDVVQGDAGADILDGGAGDDILKGAASGELTADTFVFKNAGYGFDKVKGFVDGLDQIDLSDFNFTDFATDVQPLAAQAGNHLDIDFGGGNVLRLEQFDLANFDAADVIL
ncbi:MAG: M10 family metallopeptidase C-terminal domain-containing protein [Pseudomonadota bacterium]